jgi:hypothetical protein
LCPAENDGEYFSRLGVGRREVFENSHNGVNYYDGSGPMANMILHGNFKEETLKEATRLFIKHLMD